MKKRLDDHSIPYAVHIELGERSQVIVAMAKRLECDEIVFAPTGALRAGGP